MSLSVVVASDDRYAIGAGMVMQSVLENTAAPIHFLYLCSDLSRESQSRIEQVVAARPDCRLEMVDVGEELAKLPTPLLDGVYSRLTYARLLAPSLLDADRAVYLDADVLVKGDVQQLYETNLQGHAFGAVADYGVLCWLCHSPEQREYYDELMGGVAVDQYFNAGVLVMDLCEWRRRGISDQALEVIRTNPNLRYADQCALNSVMLGDFHRLPQRWNLFQMHEKASDDTRLDPALRDSLRQAYRDPALIHYICDKPWGLFPMAFKADYQECLRRSPWKGYRERFRDLPSEQQKKLVRTWRQRAIQIRIKRDEVTFNLLGNSIVKWNRAA